MTKAAVLELLDAHGVDLGAVKVAIVGIRGYYLNTMGKPGKNDRGIYDDALFVISKQSFDPFRANTDPSIMRKGIATLVPGVYEAVKWRHKGKYPALQIVRDRVTRDGMPGIDEGRHGINFHYGGKGTWSEGCQTLQRGDWPRFRSKVYSLMDAYGLEKVTYLLVENK